MHSRLPKLLLAAFATALAIPAAAPASMITYIDGKNVWVASPDGAIKRQITHDGTASIPYHVPSADDQGNVLAVAGGTTNSKVLVHVAPDGTRKLNVLPWKVGSLPNFGPYTMRIHPDGRRFAFKYVHNQGLGIPMTDRLSVAQVNAPAVPGIGTFDQPGAYWTPTWADSKVVVAQDGVAKLELQPAQFTQFLAMNDARLRIHGVEVSRDKSRYLVDVENSQNGQRGLILYAHAGAFPGGTVTGGCQVPSISEPDQTWGLSPDGRQVTWQDSGGVKVGTFEPSRSSNGWCTGTVTTISATGEEPTFGAATLSTPQDPPPPGPGPGPDPGPDPTPPTQTPTPPAKPAPLTGQTAPRTVRTTSSGEPAAPATGHPELQLAVPATAKAASLRRGLRVEASAPAPGRLTAKLTARGRTLGTARKTVAKAGGVTLKLALTKAGRKQVKRLKGKQARLTVTFVPKGGGAKLTTSARVTLR